MASHVADRDGERCAACGFDCDGMAADLRAQLGEYPGRTARTVPLGRVLVDSGYDPGRSLWEVDHLVALVDGGSGEPEWLWVLCQVCHGRKASREAMRRSGRDATADYLVVEGVGRAETPAQHRAWWARWLRFQATPATRVPRSRLPQALRRRKPCRATP